MLRQLRDAARLPAVRRAFWLLLGAALLLLALGQWTDLDLRIEDYYYDSQQRAFPWRDSWFARDFMHGTVKNVIIKSGYLILLVVLLDAVMPWKRLRPLVRTRLRFVALASLLIPALVRVLRQFSVLHCPWSIDRYGGVEPFLRLLQHVPPEVQAGHCFPAAHATVGLWLTALCVFFLPQRPRAALVVFVAGLGAGLVLGWVQQMRGAHFLFHTLWSAWLASLAIGLLLLLFARHFLLPQTDRAE